MFSKDSKPASGHAKDRVPSIISASLRIVGDLVSEGDVQVDGLIEGDVNARSLTVSEGAAVKGQISAQKVLIRGEVHGQVTAEAVELGRSARVIGDIVHADLTIESGAFLEGHCRHMERPALPPQARVPENEDEGADAPQPQAVNG
jgi:cytoskeletal protein CcmA (bactofilin family)